MIHEGQLEVFDLTLTAKAPVFIGSGKSYVKKEYVFLTPRFARVSCDEVMLLDETKFFICCWNGSWKISTHSSCWGRRRIFTGFSRQNAA